VRAKAVEFGFYFVGPGFRNNEQRSDAWWTPRLGVLARGCTRLTRHFFKFQIRS
jgi:hypothetical protein